MTDLVRKNEVQIIATVKSLNPAVNPVVPALIGAGAGLDQDSGHLGSPGA
jgi:polyribonucleotide nucleotidyltransferase